MIKKIFISAGHGKKGSNFDSGAVSLDGTKERDIVRTICQFAKMEAEFFPKCVFVGVDREMSLSEKIDEIADICRAENLDEKNSLLVEIHCDSSIASKDGVGAYFSGTSATSKKFAEFLGVRMAGVGIRKHIWTRSDLQSNFGSLGILSQTKPLECLIEIGRLSGNDLEFLKNKAKQKALGQWLFYSLVAFAGLEEEKNLRKIEWNQKQIWNYANNDDDKFAVIRVLANETAEIARKMMEKI